MYQADGQIIHAESCNAEHCIYFHDESRMISGKFDDMSPDDFPFDSYHNQYDLQRIVMQMYDRGTYENTLLPRAGFAR